MTNPRSQVFLSHNSADKPAVQAVQRWLESQIPPVCCWLDVDDLRSTESWLRQLEVVIESCHAAMLFFGPHGMGKVQEGERQLLIDRALREAGTFLLIPVLLPGAKPSDVQGFTKLHNWVDFTAGLDSPSARERLLAFARGQAPRHRSADDELPKHLAPFRGLERFDADHAAYFFGRDAEIKSLCERTRKWPFVAVIGGSGSGKSSLVRAGLSTDVAREQWVELGDAIRITVLPGSNPLRSLAEQVARAVPRESGEAPERLADQLEERFWARTEGDGLLTALTSRFSSDRQFIVLVIDQFEELFTHAPESRGADVKSRDQVAKFVEMLAVMADSRQERLRILVTLRADFLDRCLNLPRLVQLMQDRQLLLGPLAPEALRDVIVKPATRAGAYFEKGLVARVLTEVEDQEGSLPLLQHALKELWGRRSGRWLTNEAYDEIGGVPGALQKRADATLREMSPQQRDIAKNIFLRLVSLGEGVSDTRRRVQLVELLSADREANKEIEAVIDRLRAKDARLIVTNADQTVEVTHEALIQNWHQFRDWLRDERDDVRLHHRLAAAAREWRDSHPDDATRRDASILWEGTRLQAAASLANARQGTLNELEETFLTASVGKLVNRLHTIKLESAPELLRELVPYLSRARDNLHSLRADSSLDSKVCLFASLALLSVDDRQVEYLCERLVTGSLEEFPLIRDALLPHREAVASTLWSILESPPPSEAEGRRRFRAGVALATFDPPKLPATATRWEANAELIARQLVEAVTYNPAMYASLVQAVAPAACALLPPLVAIARHHADPQRRSWSTNLTAHFAADDPSTLVDLACDVASEQYDVLFDRLKPHAARAVEALHAELQRQPAAGANQVARDALARRHASAAATLLRLNAPDDVWSLWRHAPDPSRRSHLVHRVGPLGVDPRLLAARLAEELDVSAQRALILALGEMVSVETSAGAEVVRVTVDHIQQLYREHADPGVHGAAEWTLRRWQRGEGRALSPEPASALRRGVADRRWHVNSEGQTLVLIPGPVEFLMGSPPDEEGRIGGPKDKTEQQHRKRIGRSYALAAHPVTVEQFQRFRADHQYDEAVSPGPTYPINQVTWYDAAAYCNWLSEQDAIPRDQWCYDPKQPFVEGMRVPEDFLERQGYRLLTESEWEYACRSGTVTMYFFGESEELLRQYAWHTKLSNNKAMGPVGTLKPNDLGLFDMLGNVHEWCHDVAHYYARRDDDSATEDEPTSEALDDRRFRVLRGGAFTHNASGVRSAYCGDIRPNNRGYGNGFRVARTYN